MKNEFSKPKEIKDNDTGEVKTEIPPLLSKEERREFLNNSGYRTETKRLSSSMSLK